MNITLDDGRTELWQWDTGRKIVVDDKFIIQSTVAPRLLLEK